MYGGLQLQDYPGTLVAPYGPQLRGSYYSGTSNTYSGSYTQPIRRHSAEWGPSYAPVFQQSSGAFGGFGSTDDFNVPYGSGAGGFQRPRVSNRRFAATSPYPQQLVQPNGIPQDTSFSYAGSGSQLLASNRFSGPSMNSFAASLQPWDGASYTAPGRRLAGAQTMGDYQLGFNTSLAPSVSPLARPSGPYRRGAPVQRMMDSSVYDNYVYETVGPSPRVNTLNGSAYDNYVYETVGPAPRVSMVNGPVYDNYTYETVGPAYDNYVYENVGPAPRINTMVDGPVRRLVAPSSCGPCSAPVVREVVSAPARSPCAAAATGNRQVGRCGPCNANSKPKVVRLPLDAPLAYRSGIVPTRLATTGQYYPDASVSLVAPSLLAPSRGQPTSVLSNGEFVTFADGELSSLFRQQHSYMFNANGTLKTAGELDEACTDLDQLIKSGLSIRDAAATLARQYRATTPSGFHSGAPAALPAVSFAGAPAAPNTSYPPTGHTLSQPQYFQESQASQSDPWTPQTNLWAQAPAQPQWTPTAAQAPWTPPPAVPSVPPAAPEQWAPSAEAPAPHPHAADPPTSFPAPAPTAPPDHWVASPPPAASPAPEPSPAPVPTAAPDQSVSSPPVAAPHPVEPWVPPTPQPLQPPIAPTASIDDVVPAAVSSPPRPVSIPPPESPVPPPPPPPAPVAEPPAPPPVALPTPPAPSAPVDEVPEPAAPAPVAPKPASKAAKGAPKPGAKRGSFDLERSRRIAQQLLNS